MIEEKTLANALAKAFQEEGVKDHVTILVIHDMNGNWKGAWFVTCSDRINIANTMHDLRYWAGVDPAQFDFKHLNAKRALFNLPELDYKTMQEHDRDPQRRYTNDELVHMIEEKEWPVEEDALNRVD